jgi:hypothetical protein
MNITQLNEREYISLVTDRLKQQNYKIKNKIIYDNQLFELVAKRTKLEYLVFFTTFFLISRFTAPDIQILRDFSAGAFKYAKKARGIQLPLGLFYGLRVIPVSIVDSISQETARYIRFKAPPKHWAAPEKLVVFSLEEQKIYFWELSLTIESLDEDLDRKIITEILSP